MIKIDFKEFIHDRMWFGWLYLRGSEQWIHMRVKYWYVVQAGKPGSNSNYD